MIKIRYKSRCEFADSSCITLAEVRRQFEEELCIPDDAVAELNGKKIKRKCEGQTRLNDDDGGTHFHYVKNNDGSISKTI